MPNTIPLGWVKNVYSLCVEGVLTRVNLYTASLSTNNPTLHTRVQTLRFTQTFDSFTPSLYTPFSRILHLLSTGLYTLSTPPTIKKNKEK